MSYPECSKCDVEMECFECSEKAETAMMNALAEYMGDPFSEERTDEQQANDAYEADIYRGLGAW